MASPGPWQIYDQFLNQLGLKALNLNADTLKVALFLSTSDCGNKAHATAKYSDFTNEVANGNGYTTGGVSAGAGSFTNSSGTQTLTTGAAPTWTGSGAGIVARFAVIYDATDANKRALAYALLDSTPADYTIAAGVSISVTLPSVLTVARA